MNFLLRTKCYPENTDTSKDNKLDLLQKSVESSAEFSINKLGVIELYINLLEKSDEVCIIYDSVAGKFWLSISNDDFYGMLSYYIFHEGLDDNYLPLVEYDRGSVMIRFLHKSYFEFDDYHSINFNNKISVEEL